MCAARMEQQGFGSQVLYGLAGFRAANGTVLGNGSPRASGRFLPSLEPDCRNIPALFGSKPLVHEDVHAPSLSEFYRSFNGHRECDYALGSYRRNCDRVRLVLLRIPCIAVSAEQEAAGDLHVLPIGSLTTCAVTTSALDPVIAQTLQTPEPSDGEPDYR